jgi:trk system potassium uptake protein TrkA
MRVVIAGGGHMGSHLATRLIAENHEAVVIDVDPKVTDRLFSEKGIVVFAGSATDLGVLEQAGLKRADVAVAMTGRDSDNLSFCLLARYFGVPRVLARMLDPLYEVPYRLVGATKVHSEADILVSSFLTSIDFPEVGALMPIGKGDLVACEIQVPFDALVVGRTIAELAKDETVPGGCVFIGVESAAKELQVPTGATALEGGAAVIVATHRPDLPRLIAALTGRGKVASGPRQEILQALGLVSFLQGVSKEDLADLAAGATRETQRKDVILYRAGDPGDRLYILTKGAVELEGRGRRLRLKPPAHFGEMSALTGEARTFTARVLEDSELIALDSRAFRGVLLRNPFLALELAKALSGPAETPPR